jgi:hypothetical protein
MYQFSYHIFLKDIQIPFITIYYNSSAGIFISGIVIASCYITDMRPPYHFKFVRLFIVECEIMYNVYPMQRKRKGHNEEPISTKSTVDF